MAEYQTMAVTAVPTIDGDQISWVHYDREGQVAKVTTQKAFAGGGDAPKWAAGVGGVLVGVLGGYFLWGRK